MVASSSTGTTSRGCRCTAAPGSASATCRRRPRSFAGSRWRTTSAPCWRCRCRRATSVSWCSTNCSQNSRLPICAVRPRSRSRAASGGASRSPAHWPRNRASCCSTSRCRVSTRSQSRNIRDLVAHLKDRGIGVLLTDHNVREALDIIDRAYIINEGTLLMEGAPAEIVLPRGGAARLSRRSLPPLERVRP